jgi:YjbE family integral membrane protein
MDFSNPEFWFGLLNIILIDIILSGDNAVVIALACRSLPPKHQKVGVILGAGAAVTLRVIFAIFIVYLLDVPYLKVVGGLLLFWVGYKLMMPQNEEGEVQSGANLFQAIKIIVIADAVMSLDNVIAVAAASKGSVVLLILGLLISIPLVVFGATMLLKMIDRMPWIVPGGAALIGYIGAEIALRDPSWQAWIDANYHWAHFVVPLIGAIGLVFVGRLVSPAPPPPLGKEAAGAAAIFGVRALLVFIAARSPIIVAFLASLIGYSWSEIHMDGLQAMRGMDSAFGALRPIFAAILAILVGERLARWIRPPQTAEQRG